MRKQMMLSTVSSNTPPGPTIPDAPEVISASLIGVSSFEFAYSEALGATQYYFDVSTSPTFDSFVSGYQNRLTNQQNDFRDTVTGLSGNTTYYIRMRAANSAGTSPNSTVFAVLTLPVAPIATAASNVQNTSFTANWQPVGGSFTYRLDVSTSSAFSSFVSGYENRVVNGESLSVTGLAAGATYFYRVRAINDTGASANSNTISAQTNARAFAISPRVVNCGDFGTKTTSLQSSGNWSRGAVFAAGRGAALASFTPFNGTGNSTITITDAVFNDQRSPGATMAYTDYTQTSPTNQTIRVVASANGKTIHTSRFPLSLSDFTDTGFGLEIILRLRTMSAWQVVQNDGFFVSPSFGSDPNLDQQVQIFYDFAEGSLLNPATIVFQNAEDTFELVINP